MNRPQPSTRIVITSGEPAGIGPDICLSLAKAERFSGSNCKLYVIADPELLRQRARALDLPFDAKVISDIDTLLYTSDHDWLNIIPLQLHAPCTPGQLDTANSPYVLEMLDLASDLCLQNKADAMVTAPVQKNIITEAGISFSGHTEYLADRSGATPVMMLATDSLRVALVTTHLPLKDVSQAITTDTLKQTIMTLHRFLSENAAIEQPEILVCGLNPHAGENGTLGLEEIETIIPVLNQLRHQGMKLTGPLPADTLFTAKYLDKADAVLAMYHDQGLPVLKYSGFGKAVNVTLGLPFIRTSVDHGTALELAATGKASNSSLLEAIEMATGLCLRQH